MMDVPPFMCSCTSMPLTMNPLEDSRWPLMERLPGFRSPEGSMPPVTPAMMTELGKQGRNRSHSRLNRQQIGVASSVQWQRRHLRAGNDFAKMSGRGIDLHPCGAADNHAVGLRANDECDIQSQRLSRCRP